MTLRELVALVRERLGDEYAERYTDLRIKRALNRAYREIVRQSYALEAWVSLNVAAGKRAFLLPKWISTIRSAYWEDPNGTRTDLYPYSRYRAETRFPTWFDLGQGTPRFYMVGAVNEIWLFPVPSAAGCFVARAVTLPYDQTIDPTAPVKELKDDDDEPELPEFAQMGLIEGALTELLLNLKEPQLLPLLQLSEQRFQQAIRKLTEYIDTLDDRSLQLYTITEPTYPSHPLVRGEDIGIVVR